MRVFTRPGIPPRRTQFRRGLAILLAGHFAISLAPAAFAAEPATVSAEAPAALPALDREAATPRAVKDSDEAPLIYARLDAQRTSERAQRLRKVADEAGKHVEQAQQKLTAAEQQKAEATKTITAATTARKQAEAQAATAVKSVKDSTAAVESTQQELAALAAMLKKKAEDDDARKPLEEKQAALTEELAKRKAALKAAEETLTAAQKQVEQQTKQLNTAKQQLDTADKSIAAQTAALKPLRETHQNDEKAAGAAEAVATLAAERAEHFAAHPPVADPAAFRQRSSFKLPRPAISCRFDTLGEFLMTGAQDNVLVRHDLLEGTSATLEGHSSWIRRFAMHPGGELLVTGAYDGRIMWWNPRDEKPAPIRTVEAHQGYVRAVAVSPDLRYVATGGNDGIVRIWDATDGGKLAEMTDHLTQFDDLIGKSDQVFRNHIYNIAFHPDGESLVSGDLMGVIKHWKVGTWEHVRDLDASVLHKYDTTFRAHCGGVRSFDFSPDGKHLAAAGIGSVTNAFAGTGKPTVALFDWESGERTRVLVPADNFRGTAWGVEFDPSGRFLVGVGGGTSGEMWFWKLDQEKAFHKHKMPQVAYDVAFHPDGLRVAVALYDRTVRVYDLAPKLPSELAAEEKAKQAKAKAAKAKKK